MEVIKYTLSCGTCDMVLSKKGEILLKSNVNNVFFFKCVRSFVALVTSAINDINYLITANDKDNKFENDPKTTHSATCQLIAIWLRPIFVARNKIKF